MEHERTFNLDKYDQNIYYNPIEKKFYFNIPQNYKSCIQFPISYFYFMGPFYHLLNLFFYQSKNYYANISLSNPNMFAQMNPSYAPEDKTLIIRNGERVIHLYKRAYNLLSLHQIMCLEGILEQKIFIDLNFLNMKVIYFSITDFIIQIKTQLIKKGVTVFCVKLSGGCATYILSPHPISYNDIDIIFEVDLENPNNFSIVRETIIQSLLDCKPKQKMPEARFWIDSIILKMMKFDSNDSMDRWSLFTINNYYGPNLELKFIHTLQRKYQFSMDSFHIMLDNLIEYNCNPNADMLSINNVPKIVVESTYGDYELALFHLSNRLIVTENPERIYGGGLWKYCILLLNGYEPFNMGDKNEMEMLMCERFLSDFNKFNHEQRQRKLFKYLNEHSQNNIVFKYHFFFLLSDIIRRYLNSSENAENNFNILKQIEDISKDLYARYLLEYIKSYQKYMPIYQKQMEYMYYNMEEITEINNENLHIPNLIKPMNLFVSPLVVIYVDDPNEIILSKEVRQENLNKFLTCYDELLPKLFGYCFALLPMSLFENHQATHYIVSSSTLTQLGHFDKSFLDNSEFRSSYMFHSQINHDSYPGVNYAYKKIMLSNLLPTSLFPVDFPEFNVINPSIVNRIAPLIPPPSYRLCIVNRAPIKYEEQIDSGPINNPNIIMNNYALY